MFEVKPHPFLCDCEMCSKPLEDFVDTVNSPTHYNSGGIECIEAIKASMSTEEFKGYLKGNCIKYIWRYTYKNGLEDLKKAEVYLGWLKEEVENE